MKKRYLRLLIPIIMLFMMMGVSCAVYGRALKSEYREMLRLNLAAELRERIYDVDLILKTVEDYSELASDELCYMDLYGDRERILDLIKAIASSDMIETTIVCSSDGNGYNEKGEKVYLGEESFFEEITENFGNGGSGCVSIKESDNFGNVNIAVVNRVKYSDGTKGYLISIIYGSNISYRLFDVSMELDKAALVGVGGKVIIYMNDDPDNSLVGEDFWQQLSFGIPVDLIKLNISQKNDYISGNKSYGSLIVVPSSIENGAVVAVISDEVLNDAVTGKMTVFHSFVIAIFLILIVFVALLVLAEVIVRYIRKKRTQSITDDVNTDELTGLYNRTGTIEEINKYISTSTIKKGLLFCLYVENFTRLRTSKGDEAANKAIQVFTDKLSQNYRASDIIGRMSDSEFVIFMKDISETKDIRKQVDELQLFLYDIRTDVFRDEEGINAIAGGVLYPDKGDNAEELLGAAREAMEKSKKEGNGRISFYN